MKNNAKKEAILSILHRVDVLSQKYEMNIMQHSEQGGDKMTLLMDLGCLSEKELVTLSQFKDESFIHDIVGIQSNINRRTGKLDNFFVPRCADPDKESKSGCDYKFEEGDEVYVENAGKGIIAEVLKEHRYTVAIFDDNGNCKYSDCFAESVIH